MRVLYHACVARPVAPLISCLRSAAGIPEQQTRPPVAEEDEVDSKTVPGEDTEALLAQGRFAEAREALRLARRRGRSALPLAALALVECDVLSGLGRDAEAVAVATRALSRAPADRDLAARLRVARALALWQGGRVAAGKGEAHRALDQSEQPLTRARALEALALFAWKDQEIARAGEQAAQSLALYETAGSLPGMVRAWGVAAAVERDAWRLPESLAIHDRRVAAAARLGRPHLVCQARVDRASVLTALGRWDEAARELEAAVEPAGRESIAAGLARAALAQAAGHLGRARGELTRVREGWVPGSRPRALGEWLVVSSDVALAAGDPARAEGDALEAMRRFALVADRGGRCRGRMRRAHALLSLGRSGEATAEARRALAEAGAERSELWAASGLALARTLLGTQPREAEAVCARVAELSEGRDGLAAVARFGQAVAGGAGPEVIGERLAAVEAWGDRRVLSYCLAELRRTRGEPEPAPEAAVASPSVTTEPAAAVDPVARALVEAVHAMAGEGAWQERWAAASRALAPVLPWCRAAYVGQPGFELRRDDEHARALAPDDLARSVAVRVRSVAAVDLHATPDLRLHPTRALHGLRSAVVAPAGDALVYFDLREAHGLPSDRQVAAVAELARLLARFPAEPAAPEQSAVTVSGMIGESAAMRSLVLTLDRATRFDLTVHV